MKKASAKTGSATFELKQAPPEKEGEVILSVSGRLDREALDPAITQLRDILTKEHPQRLVLELGGLESLDSAGALTLTLMQQEAQAAGAVSELRNLARSAADLKSLLDPAELAKQPLIPGARKQNFINELGESFLEVVDDFKQMLVFLGDFSIAAGRAIKKPKMIRWHDVALYMERVGVDGLPIVGLISFLLGLIIAFMSSLQLASFGANIFVASLVAVAMVRELGPIMTAVLIAGRSGSSFAAEIGTMKVNEEVDALEVMGYNPTAFLAIPKVLASLIVIPLLTLYADLLAILGGMMVGVLGLDLSVYSYVQQTIKSLDVSDVTSGLLKSMFFAVIIAGVGCQRGFTVRGGAQAVGSATTSAVVTAMFLIIVTDSVFAIVLHYMKW
jgi:phospholipid/cholesterol/gamma-HCH transport system permease protein